MRLMGATTCVQAEGLREEFCCYGVDLSGFGDTPRGTSREPFAQHVCDALAVVDYVRGRDSKADPGETCRFSKNSKSVLSPAYLQGVLMTQALAMSNDSPLCCTTLGQVLLHATHNILAFAMYILHIISWNGNRSNRGIPHL